jgi:hypothetical protein
MEGEREKKDERKNNKNNYARKSRRTWQTGLVKSFSFNLLSVDHNLLWNHIVTELAFLRET